MMYRTRIRLSVILSDLHMSRRDLADLTHIPLRTISRMVNEDVESVALQDIASICQALEILIPEMFELEYIGNGRDDYLQQREKRIKTNVNKARQTRRYERQRTKSVTPDSYYYTEYIRSKAQQRDKDK